MRRAWWLLLLLGMGCQRTGLGRKLHEEAELATREGRLQDAAATLERALRFDPADEVALERLVELKLRLDDPAGAYASATNGTGRSARSLRLRNARILAAIRLEMLADVLSDARALDLAGGLSQGTEQAVVQALVNDALKSSPSLWTRERLPEKWSSAVLDRLLETTDSSRAAALFLARPEEERTSEVGNAFKQRLLERAYQEDFALEVSILAALTQTPKTPLEYLARLELARQTRSDDMAERLRPPPELLQPPYADAWQLGLARLAARRQDWFGVLQRTRGTPYAEARSEARRQALRSAAHVRLNQTRAARAQLAEWLSEPEASEAWSATLLLPELGDATLELKKMRAALETARATRSPKP